MIYSTKSAVPIYIMNFYFRYRDMLKLGSSKPWPDALEAICGVREMDSGPILEYFKPLSDWLKAENQKNGVRVGWDDKCPEGSFPPTDSASSSAYSMVLLMTALFVHLFK